MTMQKIRLLIALALALLLISCGSSPRKQIVGQWKAGDVVWDFASNGTLTTNGQEGRYKFGDNDRVKIQTGSAIFVYQFQIKGDQMTWKGPGGSTVELKRVR